MAFTLICSGVVSQDVSGAALCSTGWEASLASLPFDPSHIDPLVATEMFGAGFALFITPFATAWGLRQLLHFLRY